MPITFLPIEQVNFPGSDPWILDWFGGLVDNPNDFRNPSIECIFTPCTPNPMRASRFVRHITNQRCATVGITALPTLALGRPYIDGALADPSEGFREETIDFEFNPGEAGSIEETLLQNVGINEESLLINKSFTESHVQSHVKLVKGSELDSSDTKATFGMPATGRTPKALTVLFHELEIIRFYYTNSNHLISAVFNGDFAQDQIAQKVTYTAHEIPRFDEETNQHRFEYRKGFNKFDACLIARALFDTEQFAMNGIRRVNQSLVASKVNELNPRRTGYPRTNFPYQTTTELKLTGRRVKCKGKFIFVVHRIEACSAPFPFKDLSIQCEFEPGSIESEEEVDDEVTVPGRNKPPKLTGPGANRGPIDTEGRPAARSDSKVSLIDIRRFSGLKIDHVKTENLRPAKIASTALNRVFDPGLVKTATGTPTHGNSNSIRHEITDLFAGSENRVDLDDFVELLKLLKEQHQDWEIRTIPLGNKFRRDPITDIVYNLFPEVACPKHRLWRQFSFLDKDKLIRRQLICVEIEIDGHFLYLLEAERRVNEMNFFIEEMPMLLVWSPNFGMVESVKFEELVTDTVKIASKTWLQDVSSLSLNKCNINGVGSLTHEELVEKVSKFVTRALEMGMIPADHR